MKRLLAIIIIFVSALKSYSQYTIPQCPSTNIYLHVNPIQVYNPNLPLSATNPSNTNIPGGGTGLCLGPNLNASGPCPTFYTIIGGQYNWWNGSSWVNTGHFVTNGAAVNLGSGGGNIYNLVGSTGQVYKYNGSGNDVLLVTIAGFNSGGPYDISCDCNGDWYILQTTNPQSLRKYDPSGSLLTTYALTGMPNTVAGGGMAVINGTVFCRNSNGFFVGPISGGSVNFVPGPNIVHPGDFASCPNTTTNCPVGVMSVSVANTGPLACNPNPTANVSVTVTVSPASYTWSGPGIVGSVSNSIAVVNLPGVYTATISGGCPTTQTVVTTTVTAIYKPLAAFSFTQACMNMPMNFVNTSSTNGGTPLSIFVWKWNDGSSNSTSPSATHIYTSVTTKTVELVVTNTSGCKDSITQTVNLYPSPVANFTFNNICQGGVTNFNNTTNSNGSNITNWYWDLDGDGTNDNNSVSPVLVMPSSGQFNTKLTVVTDKGCSDTITKLVNVYSKPVAKFQNSKACLGDFTQFTDVSYLLGSNGQISGWSWDFDNNGSIESTFQNPLNLYSSTGSKTISLIVSTNFGCADTLIQSLYVNVFPKVNFSADKLAGCAMLPVNFTSTTSISVGSVVSYTWSLGKALVSNNPNFSFEFPAGNYTVGLAVSSDSGCVAKMVINNYIDSWPVPIANYVVTPQTTDILEPLVNFINITEGPYTQWWWYFGDTGKPETTVKHPSHLYDSEVGSNYMTTLIVMNKYGCSDTLQKLVVVNPSFVVNFPNCFTPNDDGLNDVFQGKGYYIDNIEFDVFDRWGEKIFTSKDMFVGWDGTVKGKLAEEAVYTWRAVVIDWAHRSHLLTGHVTLLK